MPHVLPQSIFSVKSLAIALFAGTFLIAIDAKAFCRTTTCSAGNDTCEYDADGCETSAPVIFWKSRCVRFDFQRSGTRFLDPEQTKNAIATSFTKWTNVSCAQGGKPSLTFTIGDNVWVGRAQYDDKGGGNINVVFFHDDDWPYEGMDTTLATTRVSFNKRTGEIWDADIAIKNAGATITMGDKNVQSDLESVVLHEVGHFIGIAHSRTRNAAMYESLAPGTLRRDLEPDDVEAMCAIYPPGREAECNDVPRGGFLDPDVPDVPQGCTVKATAGTGGQTGGAHSTSSLLTYVCLLFGLSALRRGSTPRT
jgi:Matrixin